MYRFSVDLAAVVKITPWNTESSGLEKFQVPAGVVQTPNLIFFDILAYLSITKTLLENNCATYS